MPQHHQTSALITKMLSAATATTLVGGFIIEASIPVISGGALFAALGTYAVSKHRTLTLEAKEKHQHALQKKHF